jgi:hypothetical protein
MQKTAADDRRTATNNTDASAGWRREYHYQGVAPDAIAAYDPPTEDIPRDATPRRAELSLAEWAGCRP